MAMLRLNKLGFVFQTFNLLSSLTAMENVEIPMLLQGRRSRRERRDRAQSLYFRLLFLPPPMKILGVLTSCASLLSSLE